MNDENISYLIHKLSNFGNIHFYQLNSLLINISAIYVNYMFINAIETNRSFRHIYMRIHELPSKRSAIDSVYQDIDKRNSMERSGIDDLFNEFTDKHDNTQMFNDYI